ncbi:MAG TPA: S8 family serine peptidase [Solirubrobacteraceae bacterium]|nr:S8 family serine peptidase [Solirubrobacteraceae bacterium]
MSGQRLKACGACTLVLAAVALVGLAGGGSPRAEAAATQAPLSPSPSAQILPPPSLTGQAAISPGPTTTSTKSLTGAYAPDRIVVKYAPSAQATRSARAATSGAGESSEEASSTHLLTVPAGVGLDATLVKLRREKNVVWAVPDYVAHTTSVSIPNDPGITGHTPGGWQQTQWNFDGTYGINASQAWANVAADGAPGGAKVIVAVLDTGVAYANRGKYRRSPDFSKYSFVRGYDFIDRTPYANDHNGHGTFVAGTIAEATNNHYGLTGLAYAARIMPVRVLDSAGEGDASVIAEGVRFAVNHHAQIINLSLEFSSDVGASDIPELIEALRYAYRHNVLVVAAAGNEGSTTIPYPARAGHVIAVGATTEHGCLASYSNDGRGITLVAPGGGPDASLPGDPNCNPELPSGGDIFQMTFTGSSPRVFGFPNGYEGTSMATPHVAATAALIIAAHILGPKPTVAQLTARLKDTARKLGDPQDQALYGAGLLNAAAATAPGGPAAIK